MRHRYMFTIHGIGVGLIPRSTLDAVQHQLVAQKIQINPVT